MARWRRIRLRWRVAILAVIGVTSFVILADVFYKTDDEKLQALDACHQFVSRKLVSPAGADYEPFSEAVFQHDGEEWIINGHVDSRNVLGVNLRSNYVCDMTHVQGNEFHAIDIEVNGK